MTIVQLDYLLAVANYGSFSAAAEHCFVTQPSLSMQIKALEEELDTVLLDRTKKPVIPTDAGEAVIEQARIVLHEFGMVKELVHRIKGEVVGRLRLGVIPTIAPYLLHKFIPDFVARYPGVELDIREMKTADIIGAFNRDKIDAAIVAGGTCGDGILEYELFDDRFYAYVSPANSLYKKSNIRKEDIDMHELVLLSVGNCMRDQVLELCQARARTDMQYIFESGSLDTLMRIVDSTSNITIIPEMAIEYLPAERRRQVKTLFKGGSLRKISLAVRRTYAKRSIVEALRQSILDSRRPHEAVAK